MIFRIPKFRSKIYIALLLMFILISIGTIGFILIADYNFGNETYALDKLISEENDELKQQLLLKEWIFKSLKLGTPSEDYSDKSAFGRRCII